MEKKQAETADSISRNILYGFSTWILPLGLSFMATPILVRALGHEDYGIYYLVLGFIAYSFNFSIGRAITKYISEYRATGENEKIRDVISATFFLNVVLGLAGLVVIILSAGWLVSTVFRIETVSETKTVQSFYLAAVIIFLAMLTQVFSAVLQGIHRFDVYSKIYNFNSFSLILGNILLALNDFGLLPILAWNLTISLVTCLVYLFSAKKLLPEFGLSLKFPAETLKLVMRFSGGVVGYQILANALLLFERGWITRQLGAENLTYYVVPMMLGLYIHSFIASLMIVIFPLASELKDFPERLLRLYTKATKIVCLLVVFMGATLIVHSHNFLTLWMGPEFADRSARILILHTITFSLLAILTVSWQMTEGLGFPNYNFKIFSVCLVVCVGLMIALTDNYAGPGVAAARLTGFSMIFLSIFYVEKWFFGRVQIKLWLKILFVLLPAAVLAGLIEKLIIGFHLSWLQFILSGTAGGLIYFLIVWGLGFITADEKLLIRKLLRR